MRLIDIDALEFTTLYDIQRHKDVLCVHAGDLTTAPAWSCEECKHEEPGEEQHIICDFCRGFSFFERRGDEE